MGYLALNKINEPCFNASWREGGIDFEVSTSNWCQCEAIVDNLVTASLYDQGVVDGIYYLIEGLLSIKKKTYIFSLLCITSLLVFVVMYRSNKASSFSNNESNDSYNKKTNLTFIQGLYLPDILIFFLVTLSLSGIVATEKLDGNGAFVRWIGIMLAVELLCAGLAIVIIIIVTRISKLFTKKRLNFGLLVWVLFGITFTAFTYPSLKVMINAFLDTEIIPAKYSYEPSESGNEMRKTLKDILMKSRDGGGFGSIKFGDSYYFISGALTEEVKIALSIANSDRTEQQHFLADSYLSRQKVISQIKKLHPDQLGE